MDAITYNTGARNRGLAFVYAATIFVSAFLLFQIQPMVSKAILPWFGGTPAVWTICLLFFQSLLFAGYAYAHFMNHSLAPRQQAGVHILVIIIALALLGVLPGENLKPTGEADPTRAILTILAITIGLPYFVLSATGPLLQAWFARSFPGRAPYRLYALSNIGSLLALLSFPFIFERHLDLVWQSRLWTAGFILFGFLCAYAAWRVWKLEPNGVAGVEAQPSPQTESPTNEATAAQPHYFLWLLLPAFASIVLMATTNHISTDVAVVPLLWIIPLALYLLTFIIAFDRPAWYWPTLTAVLTLAFIYPTAALYKNNNVGTMYLYKSGMTGRIAKFVGEAITPKSQVTDESADEDEEDAKPAESPGPHIKLGFTTALVVNFATMFGICMLCHGQLARLKPPTKYLTAYYLMISAGGALGGIAVSIIAPRVFHTIFEWQLAIFAAAVGAVAVILSALVARSVGLHRDATEPTSHKTPTAAARVLLLLVLLPISLLMLDLVEFLFSAHKNAVYQSRNFFGALTIRDENKDDPKTHERSLLNGTTLHGSQFMLPERRIQPTTYYATTSGVGLVLNYFHNNRPPGGVRVADVGLGAGTLAAYGQKGDTIVFYEINPTVLDISNTGTWFTYLTDARTRGAHCDIKLGDARLSFERAVERAQPDGAGRPAYTLKKGEVPYHVVVLDAFSGDAVPTHLLTAEAMDIYLPHLATKANMDVDGALLIHVSNRYLDLDRVARGAADYLGYEHVAIHNPSNDDQSINTSDWIILTRNKSLLAELASHAEKPDADEKPPVLWTDAHSSLFEILR
jgi:hypothetical protein